MSEKNLIVKRSAGAKSRGRGVEIKSHNKFFITYKDKVREVQNIEIDYDDYNSASYDEIKQNIAKNIARLRKEKGFSYEDVAEKAWVSRQYIAQIENGERNVSLDVLANIAKAFGVTVEFLIKKSPFKPSNIYLDKLVAELKELDVKRQKTICAEIIEKLWIEHNENGGYCIWSEETEDDYDEIS